MDILSRIERHMDPMVDGQCWTTSYKVTTHNPYPRMFINGKAVKVMRIFWEAHHGEPVPEGMVLRHTCNNPACVNPEHIVPGTHSENMQDSVRAGTHYYPRNPTTYDWEEFADLRDEQFTIREISWITGANPASICEALQVMRK